jgi:hypothetical protein
VSACALPPLPRPPPRRSARNGTLVEGRAGNISCAAMTIWGEKHESTFRIPRIPSRARTTGWPALRASCCQCPGQLRRHRQRQTAPPEHRRPAHPWPWWGAHWRTRPPPSPWRGQNSGLRPSRPERGVPGMPHPTAGSTPLRASHPLPQHSSRRQPLQRLARSARPVPPACRNDDRIVLADNVAPHAAQNPGVASPPEVSRRSHVAGIVPAGCGTDPRPVATHSVFSVPILVPAPSRSLTCPLI